MSARHGRASRAQAITTINAFAELLSEGTDPQEAATLLGFNPGYGWQLLRKIRTALGAQAQ